MPEKFVQKNQEQANTMSKERLGRDLFATIDKLSQDVSRGLERRKDEILTWPQETKETEAGTSDDLLVINLLSKQPDIKVKVAVAQNINVPSGVVRRFIEEDTETLVPLATNPNLQQEFIELITIQKEVFSDESWDDILNYLLANHPNTTDFLKKKYTQLGSLRVNKDKISLFLSEAKRLPLWVTTTLKRDGYTDQIIGNINSFTSPDKVIFDLIKDGDDSNCRRILELLSKSGKLEGLRLTNELAQGIILRRRSDWVLEHINLFPDLHPDDDFANLLLKNGDVSTLARFVSSFKFEKPRGLIDDLISYYNNDQGKGYQLREACSKIVRGLIEAKEYLIDVFEAKVFDFYVRVSPDRNLVEEVFENVSVGTIDQSLANILIDCKYFIELNNSLDKFDLANPLDLIQRLLDKTDNHSDGARDLLGKLISVSGLTFDSVVAERIVKKEWFDVLKQEIKSFDNLNEDIAVTLINRDKDGAMFVTQNVDKFKGLSQDVALLLIRNGCAKWVVDNINRFSDIGSVLIAEILKTGLWSVESVRKLRQMEAIDLKELEKAVMESEPTAEGFKIMMENMDVFGKMKDSKNILSYLTNMFPPNGPLFIEHFDKLSVLGFEYLAEEMIKAGLGSTVVDNLERFRGVDRKKIVDMLINIGQKEYVERNFEKFAGLTKNGDVKESLKNSSSEAYLVADSVEKFDGVIPDKTQLIVNLIRDGKHRHLDTSFWMLDLRRFKGLDFRTVAIALLEYDKYSDYLKEKGATIDVQNASDMDIVKALIKNEHVPFVLDYIEHFQIDDYNDLVNYIIELNWGVLLLDHLGYLRETEDSPLRSIKFNKDQALQILTKIDGFYDKFPKLAKYFDNLDKDVAYAIMEREYRNGSDPTKFFMENTNLFKGLTKKMVKDYMEQLTGKKGK